MAIRTVDNILEALRKEVESPGSVLNPELWIEAGFNLNLLLGGEQSKLFKLQQDVAVLENEEYQKDGKSTAAKTRVRATDLYREYESQKARVKNVEEFIRLAKVRAKLAGGSY